MKATVNKFDSGKEYFLAEGCFIVELSNSAEDPDLSIARARVEPGKTTRWHSLAGIAERYVILEGHGLVEVDDVPAKTVSPGDVVLIPPQARQRITNTGEGDLLFLALCTPPFRHEAYQDLEI